MSNIIVKQSDISADIKKYLNMAREGDTVIVPQKDGRDVVIISGYAYKELEKIRRNAEYLAMLDESDRQLREGRIVVKTMAELEAMAEE